MYNLVYDALKAVDRKIQVGGPYLVIEGTGSNKKGADSERGDWSWATETPIRARQWEVLDYWLKHKKGAEFFVIDRSIKDYHDRNTYTEGEQMGRTHLFGDIVRQIRARTDLPVWFAEFYASGKADGPEAQAAINASALRHALLGGASAVLLWQPMDTSEVGHALFSDARQPGGARPYPLYGVFKAFHDHFGPGTRLFEATSSSPDVEVLASATETLLINKRAAPVTVRRDGRSLPLRAYEVRLTTGGA